MQENPSEYQGERKFMCLQKGGHFEHILKFKDHENEQYKMMTTIILLRKKITFHLKKYFLTNLYQRYQCQELKS